MASAGDLINYQLVTGSTGTTITVRSVGVQFAPTTSSNTVNRLACTGSISDTLISTPYYNPLSGTLAKSTTQANAQFTNKATATLQKLYVFVSANTASVATVDSQIGGSNGNLTVSIGSGVTGALEDTTHTDSTSSGDLLNTALNATVATTFTITNISLEYLTTSAQTHYLNGLATGTTVALSTTTNSYFGGSPTVNATESNVQMKTGIAFTASNLEGFVITNTLTATSTVKFRVAGANGNQVISYGSGVTGYLEDTTHSDAVTASNEINYQIITGGSGTSIIFGNIGILADYTVAAGGTILPFPWVLTTGNMRELTGGMRN